MKFTIPEKMPARSDYIREFLEAIFPEGGSGRSGNYYSPACDRAAEALELKYFPEEKDKRKEADNDNGVELDSNVFRLMYELNCNYKIIFRQSSDLIDESGYKYYKGTLLTFCSKDNGSLRNWLKPCDSTGKMAKSFDAALFFTYLLYSRPECESTRTDFLLKSLKYAGIEDVDGAVMTKLRNPHWDALKGEGRIDGQSFSRLSDPAIILTATAALTVFNLMGRCAEEPVKAFHAVFREMLRKNIEASEAFDFAENALVNSNKYFEPRSIETAEMILPQNMFVMPAFSRDDTDADCPVVELAGADDSRRLMIVAKTGLGKSAFLQMTTLCMLKDRYKPDTGCEEELNVIAAELGVPDGTFIISVPARMFSYCFGDRRYREWTDDLVTLFFNSMWRLSANFNFFSTQLSQRYSVRRQTLENDFSVTDELREYIGELAKKGKLLLMLDSFDEISAGDMRNAYLKAVSRFYGEFCCFWGKAEVGAHVIISSREMSPDTMTKLKRCIEINDAAYYSIKPLGEAQREKLVRNWNRWGNADYNPEELLDTIEKNHFYREYSKNPYMLSTVCYNFGQGLVNITDKFIGYLIERMQQHYSRANSHADLVILDVLMNIGRLLQDIAADTVIAGKASFSRAGLDKAIGSMIDPEDIPDGKTGVYIEKLHEIFVTEVGLIVPADGHDMDYQFVNSCIRFSLAAKGIKRRFDGSGQMNTYVKEKLDAMESTVEYAGLIVPLLSLINLENAELAETLVSGLAMRECNSDDDEQVLLEAMVDLLMNRYGTSIVSVGPHPGADAAHIRRAQRLLLMRVLTSAGFEPQEHEKESIRRSQAYLCNENRLSDGVKNLLF